MSQEDDLIFLGAAILLSGRAGTIRVGPDPNEIQSAVALSHQLYAEVDDARMKLNAIGKMDRR